ATGTYWTESIGGLTGPKTYPLWGSVSVPDSFVIPGEFRDGESSKFEQAVWDDFVEYALQAARNRGIPGAEMATVLNDNFGLYDALKSHLDDQFELINDAMAGRIDAETLLRLSDAASARLLVDLGGGLVGAPAVAVDIAKTLVSRWIVGQGGMPDEFTTGQNFPGLNWIGPGWNPKNILVVGSPTNDSLDDWATNGDYVLGGAGDDVIYGGRGSDVLIGGSGVDTIDYSRISDGVNIDLLGGVVRASSNSFSDVALGFENATGSSGNDIIAGTSGANVLNGDRGADLLSGGDGDDVLIGGRSGRLQRRWPVGHPVAQQRDGRGCRVADERQHDREQHRAGEQPGHVVERCRCWRLQRRRSFGRAVAPLDGRVAEWQMNGTAITSDVVLGNPGTVWQVADVGDYNGDGKSDILWRNSSTGAVAEWQMNGNTILSNEILPTSASLDWHLV
ncbi:type I secretion target GGXGXDXXX repeat-containing domain protein, partial [Ostertagia ostertagi]